MHQSTDEGAKFCTLDTHQALIFPSCLGASVGGGSTIPPVHNREPAVPTCKRPRLLIVIRTNWILQHILDPHDHGLVTLDRDSLLSNVRKTYHLVVISIIRLTTLELALLRVICGRNSSHMISAHVGVESKCFSCELTEPQTAITECLVDLQHTSFK